MKHALIHWEDIRKRLEHKKIFLFCDFDGTLTPIRPRPGLVILGSARRKFLEGLTHVPGVKLAFISGRALEDLKQKVPVSGAVYAGNHGLEASGPELRFLAPLPAGWRKTLADVKHSMLVLKKKFPGLLIEDKQLTLSLHYRRVPMTKQAACRKAVLACAKALAQARRIIVHCGKKVVEIRPPLVWHKGSIVQWFLRRRGHAKAVAVYIGDDITDEDAFKTIGARGVTIFVGQRRGSAARYYLNSVNEVYQLLKNIKRL